MKKSKIIFWMGYVLTSLLLVTAYHPKRTQARINPSSATISPLMWIFILALIGGTFYFFYWILTRK